MRCIRTILAVGLKGMACLILLSLVCVENPELPSGEVIGQWLAFDKRVLMAAGCILLAVWVDKKGGIIFYTWYADNKKRSQSMMLTICMNSGKNLQILFINKDFLNRVLSVLEKIIIDGGIGNQNISIDLSGSQFAGDAQVLNNLGINQK